MKDVRLHTNRIEPRQVEILPAVNGNVVEQSKQEVSAEIARLDDILASEGQALSDTIRGAVEMTGGMNFRMKIVNRVSVVERS